MIPIQSVTVLHEDLRKAEMEYETIKSERDGLDRQLAEMALSRDQAVTERNAAQAAELAERETRLKTQKALAESVTRERELREELDKRPLPTTPPVPTKITRTSLPRLAGFTIEKSKSSPSTTLYNQVKTAMRWGQSMGLTHWRGFFNATEVAQHVGLKASTLGNLPDYGRSLGLGFIADTIDNDGIQALDNAAFKAYIEGLIKMGAEGVYINDADRAALPFDRLTSLIARVRAVNAELPIFLSLLGSAKLELYKPIADHIEIQTFGSLAELTTFLKRDVIMCLDMRKALTAADIKARAEIALKAPPKQFFLYADLPTDYDAMPDEEDELVRAWVKAWKTLG